MPFATFLAPITNTAVHAAIADFNMACSYASGLLAYDVDSGKQLRVRLRDGAQKVVLTIDYQPQRQGFFCRTNLPINLVVAAGIVRSNIRLSETVGQPLKTEFHATEAEFVKSLPAIVATLANRARPAF
jgi:hypothetical protein